MRKYTVLFILLTFSLTLFAQGKVYSVEDVPLVHLKDARRYVCNPDKILSQASVSIIDSLFYKLEEKTGIQTVVAVLGSIKGGDCFDFAHRLGEKNGVGQKQRDNGLVILLSTEERCILFATGYGLEGVLPDAICKRIQQKYMVEHFAAGDWDRGMVEGMRALCARLDGSMENVDDEENDAFIIFVVCAVVTLLLVVAVAFGVWWHGRCPNCKKRNIIRVSERVLSRANGYIVSEITYRCKDCGHIYCRKITSIDPSYKGPQGGGGIYVGGGGRSGGGFSGGSFGGGHFGGGGAGSRF